MPTYFKYICTHAYIARIPVKVHRLGFAIVDHIERGRALFESFFRLSAGTDGKGAFELDLGVRLADVCFVAKDRMIESF